MQILKVALTGKTEELASIRDQNSGVINSLNKNYGNSEDTLFDVRKIVDEQQADITRLKKEKKFLQVQNIDLEISLQELVKQSKVCKKRFFVLIKNLIQIYF